ncbi:MAG: GNAT family N-acetyltransferase [Ornithinimicrobium sp.]
MTMGNVVIRAFEAQDRASVMAMAGRLMTGVAEWRNQNAAQSAVSSWVADSLDAADPATQPVMVAVSTGDTVVGLVTTGTRPHWTGDVDAYVGELVVTEQAAGQGIGRRLMEAAEEWAASVGHQRLTIETGGANTAARGFYMTAGYVEEEVILSKALLRAKEPSPDAKETN